MNNIWDIIKEYSFSKDEAIDVYCKVLVDEINNNSLKELTLWYAIKFLIDEKKVAVNSVLDQINVCFESIEDKISKILDSNSSIDPNAKRIILDLFRNKVSSRLTLLRWVIHNINSEEKEDIIIDWTLPEEEFLSIVMDLDLKIKQYKSEWNIVLVWPYISDTDLDTIKNIAKDILWIK